MQSWIARHQWQTALTACLVALGLVGTLFGVASPVAAATPSYCGETLMQQPRTILPGHLIPALHGAVPLRALECNTVLSLTIAFKPRDQAALNAFMQALSDPQSPEYHHYLTTQEYADRFGQTPETIEQLSDFLRSAGFTIVEVLPNRLGMRVTATVADIEQAFAVQLGIFTYQGHTVHAPLAEPSIPASYAPAMQAIIGLSNLPVAFVPR